VNINTIDLYYFDAFGAPGTAELWTEDVFAYNVQSIEKKHAVLLVNLFQQREVLRRSICRL